MNPFLWLVDTIITIYIWLLIASAILSWLIAFNVVNTRNPIVHSVGNFLYQITEPLLRPIRSMLPNLGGIDISPVILIIVLLFLRQLIFWLYIRTVHLGAARPARPWTPAAWRRHAVGAPDAQGRP